MGMHSISSKVLTSIVHEIATATATIPVPHEQHGHPHGLPILKDPNLTDLERTYWTNYNTTTYFTTCMGKRFALKYHITTLLLIIIITYPACLILENVKSKWYLPCLTLNLITTLSSLLAILIFHISFKGKNDPNWYPNNIYPKLCWILFIWIIVHYISAILMTKWYIKETNNPINYSHFQPNNNYKKNKNKNSRHQEDFPLQDLSHTTNSSENLTGASSSSNTLPSPPELQNSPSFNLDNDNSSSLSFSTSSPSNAKTTRLSNNIMSDLENGPITTTRFPMKQSRLKSIVKIIFYTLNIPLFLYLLTYMGIGFAIGNLFGKGIRVYNLLAHWIKGGVFFLLGILSLSRYMGLGSKYGWAWNKILFFENNDPLPMIFSHGVITMEGMESFLIFFYGITNIFLEHLAGAGGAWTPKDLQHVSIAFIYIGSGLCGLLVEYKLKDWRYKTACDNIIMQDMQDDPNTLGKIVAATPGFSPNPFPTLTIFWTGILMSQHAQISMTSTIIHTQWGYLLSYGSIFRLFTFLILYFNPTKLTSLSYPFTELITSFCLICGGIVFMESTDQVVEAFEYRGLTPMFTFNLSVGVTTLIMAWVMLVSMWQNWLSKEKVSTSHSRLTTVNTSTG
ncbi:Tvs1p NDAI_0I00430 [Naumovozyma dairenensis CBS 421]|uniref:Protein YTP1-like C-terminal domain-containing protein n=1 Tax=Naumovozyma dairenensis (strain ATCC 10597 / BCRC 20456 / CBS 421 / NBRC 0211 / NRRL Y-12639) TaxID=1071378 RepID=G0WFQ1_NAUDC|nr:hypothetical protein NDAI_0I00430 [Naumovozyma dairenensis CBS 421]CCD26612.1 hypothetical protein NDAI_0I00430 [Naumovozyma dairenensis CBS 421]